MSAGRRTPSREELQGQMADLRKLLADGKITLTQYRVRSARLVDEIGRTTTRKPKYAIS